MKSNENKQTQDQQKTSGYNNQPSKQTPAVDVDSPETKKSVISQSGDDQTKDKDNTLKFGNNQPAR